MKSNARLTASNAAVLLVLLAAEGVTILRVRHLVSLHVFLGMLLIPPVLVKIGSTGYRFARYYLACDEDSGRILSQLIRSGRSPAAGGRLVVR